MKQISSLILFAIMFCSVLAIASAQPPPGIDYFCMDCRSRGGQCVSNACVINKQKPDTEPDASDPASEALANAWMKVFECAITKKCDEALGHPKPDPRSGPAPPQPKEAEPVETVEIVFTGSAQESSGRRRSWPFTLSIQWQTSGDGAFEGTIDWPSLRSLHRVTGWARGRDIYFREVTAIRKGAAILGCEYRATDGNESGRTGRYRCSNGDGVFWMNIRL